MARCTSCHAERSVSVECVTCHEKGIRPPHEDVVLHHAEGQRGCLDCHHRQVIRGVTAGTVH
jgi:hypothetical protein